MPLADVIELVLKTSEDDLCKFTQDHEQVKALKKTIRVPMVLYAWAIGILVAANTLFIKAATMILKNNIAQEGPATPTSVK